MPDSVTLFSERAGNYASYRPSYPRAVTDFIRDELKVRPGSHVADVGAGTGIFTRQLLEAGYAVTAVEPNDAMRSAAEQELGDQPRFRSANGRAEATGLQPQSVDLTTAAQAFHWFEPVSAREEFKRIQKPGAWTALIWNTRIQGDRAFHDAYEALIERFAIRTRAKPNPDGSHRYAAQDAFYGPGRHQLKQFRQQTELDRASLWGLYRSISYTPPPGHEWHEAAKEALLGLFDRYAVGGKVIMEYETQIHYGQIV